jgi:hypothetical protein
VIVASNHLIVRLSPFTQARIGRRAVNRIHWLNVAIARPAAMF